MLRDFAIRPKPDIRHVIYAAKDINCTLEYRSDLFTHLNSMNREAAQLLPKQYIRNKRGAYYFLYKFKQ